jgi:hypothetical protein
LPETGKESVNHHIPDTGYKHLYRIGAYAALIAVILIRRNLGVEYMTFNGFGIFDVPAAWPVRAEDWYILLNKNWYIGLILLDFFDVINYILVGLLFLALFSILHRSNNGLMLMAASFSLMGITVNIVSNHALAMLSLSHQYASAVTDTERSIILSAGESLLTLNNPGATFQGTGYYVSLFLVLLAGLLISIVMLDDKVFSKATAVIGLLANGIGLGYFLTLILLPAFIWLPPSLSALFRITWYVLIAIKLLKIAKGLDSQGKIR